MDTMDGGLNTVDIVVIVSEAMIGDVHEVQVQSEYSAVGALVMMDINLGRQAGLLVEGLLLGDGKIRDQLVEIPGEDKESDQERDLETGLFPGVVPKDLFLEVAHMIDDKKLTSQFQCFKFLAGVSLLVSLIIQFRQKSQSQVYCLKVD
eukprot:TRINITY_DN2051_c0_g4_i1.p3 TRINITY_DN2051_c0_g4~~TRINITY_DN2051_c0_g4_i1.p3  ORF type:complete len:149 (+),score=13.45 TRINITY_DN2051_c0_g4_i1:55-501(+)